MHWKILLLLAYLHLRHVKWYVDDAVWVKVHRLIEWTDEAYWRAFWKVRRC